MRRENEQEEEEENEHQQEQQSTATDSSGNVLRGRGGDMTGIDRGTMRGGQFENIAAQQQSSSQAGGACNSVEGWVLMLSNLSPNCREDDLRLLLSEEDPSGDLFSSGIENMEGGDDNNGGGGDPTAKRFITDLRMNPSSVSCGCIGHAFIKVASYEDAQLVMKLNGRSFVDDLNVRIDFAFQFPVVSSNDNNENQNQNTQAAAAAAAASSSSTSGSGGDGRISNSNTRFRGRETTDASEDRSVGPSAPPRPPAPSDD